MFNERIFCKGVDVVAEAHDWLRFPGVDEINKNVGSLNLIASFEEVEVVVPVGV